MVQNHRINNLHNVKTNKAIKLKCLNKMSRLSKLFCKQTHFAHVLAIDANFKEYIKKITSNKTRDDGHDKIDTWNMFSSNCSSNTNNSEFQDKINKTQTFRIAFFCSLWKLPTSEWILTSFNPFDRLHFTFDSIVPYVKFTL